MGEQTEPVVDLDLDPGRRELGGRPGESRVVRPRPEAAGDGEDVHRQAALTAAKVALQDDVVREEEAAAGERGVPAQPELGAVDGAGELEADPVVPDEVDACADEAARQLDRLRDVP